MTWYVNPKTGNDSNDGQSASSAFKTLSHAVGAASPGDTILIAAGVYDQDLPQQVSIARAANLTIGVAGAE